MSDYRDICEIDGVVYVSDADDTQTPLRSVSDYALSLVGQNHGASLFEATPTFASVLTPTDMGDVVVRCLHPAGYAVAQGTGGNTQLWKCDGGAWSVVGIGSITEPQEILVAEGGDVYVIESIDAGATPYVLRGGVLREAPTVGRPPELLRYLQCMAATTSRPMLWRDAYWAADTSTDGGLWAEWSRVDGYDPATLETLARLAYPAYEDEHTYYPDVPAVAVRTLSGLHCFRPMGWYDEYRATTTTDGSDATPNTHLYWIHLTQTRGYADTIEEAGGEPTPWIMRGRGVGNGAWLTGRDGWTNFGGETPTANKLYRLESMVTIDKTWELCVEYEGMSAGAAHVVVTATHEDGTSYTLYDDYIELGEDGEFCLDLEFDDDADDGVYTIGITITDSDDNEATEQFYVYLNNGCDEDTTVNVTMTTRNQPQNVGELTGDRVLWLVDNDDDRIATALRVVTDWNPADEATGLRGLVRCDGEADAVDEWGTYQAFNIGATVEIEKPGNYVRVGIIGAATAERPSVAMQLRRERVEEL